jgi:hypothetical protein
VLIETLTSSSKTCLDTGVDVIVDVSVFSDTKYKIEILKSDISFHGRTAETRLNLPQDFGGSSLLK